MLVSIDPTYNIYKYLINATPDFGINGIITNKDSWTDHKMIV